MNKKGEGEGFLLLLILFALIPMCSHAGETAYSQCTTDCRDVNFEFEPFNNKTTLYTQNGSNVSTTYVKEFCHDECRINVKTDDS